MAFNAGKWAGLLSEASAPALQNPAAAIPLAGMRSMGFLGGGSYEDFQKAYQAIPKDEREAFMNYATINTLMAPTMMQFDEEWQKRQLELADKYQTKKGWKTAMFNTLTGGLSDLTKGIAMSMNPYGTPEAARYAADMTAGSSDRMAAAYAALRTPMAIQAVQGGSAPTYF